MRFWTMGARMQVDRVPYDELIRRARRGVNKIDLLGPRGTTLCSMQEIEAMACLVAMSGLLPLPGAEAEVNETTKPKVMG